MLSAALSAENRLLMPLFARMLMDPKGRALFSGVI